MEIRRIGRPTDYTPALAEEICETIACSEMGLKKLCNEHQHWPDKKTILKWVIKYPEFSHQYARAKALQIEAIVDEVLEIADDKSQDSIVDDDGKVSYDHEHINRSRLRIDTRKWLASKLAPKIYGDKIKESPEKEKSLLEHLIDKLNPKTGDKNAPNGI